MKNKITKIAGLELMGFEFRFGFGGNAVNVTYKNFQLKLVVRMLLLLLNFPYLLTVLVSCT